MWCSFSKLLLKMCVACSSAGTSACKAMSHEVTRLCTCVEYKLQRGIWVIPVYITGIGPLMQLACSRLWLPAHDACGPARRFATPQGSSWRTGYDNEFHNLATQVFLWWGGASELVLWVRGSGLQAPRDPIQIRSWEQIVFNRQRFFPFP